MRIFPPSGLDCCATWCRKPRVMSRSSTRHRNWQDPLPGICRPPRPASALRIDILRASSDAEIELVFAGLPQAGTALISTPDAFLYSRRAKLVALSASHAVPGIFDVQDYVDAGGLVSYGADYLDVMHLAGNYTARVLKGEKPADMPVVRPEKFEFVINLKTARALGITVPSTLLATADDLVD
jgi:putative tryptophan/tyrosine transport system substrate-binding protein